MCWQHSPCSPGSPMDGYVLDHSQAVDVLSCSHVVDFKMSAMGQAVPFCTHFWHSQWTPCLTWLRLTQRAMMGQSARGIKVWSYLPASIDLLNMIFNQEGSSSRTAPSEWSALLCFGWPAQESLQKRRWIYSGSSGRALMTSSNHFYYLDLHLLRIHQVLRVWSNLCRKNMYLRWTTWIGCQDYTLQS